MLTQEELKERLFYNEETGVFTYAKSICGGGVPGNVAGYISFSRPGAAYRIISINRRNYGAHRLAFLYVTGEMPKDEVDHINGDGCDNRWVNLRSVSRAENARNQKLSKANKSGVTGVCWSKNHKSWVAQIKSKKRTRYLGMFKNIFDAACARKSAEIEYGFHKNHGMTR
ncbi:MAG: HNH endonuclease [Gammaproteobacteria bacterium]|nr:HNH endonuclease [Gammaproteobacteria bacterium]